MDTVIVQLPDPRPETASGGRSARSCAGPALPAVAARRPVPVRPALLHLGPGESAGFGRGEPGRPAAIPLADQGISRRAGEVTAAEDYWRLSNFSPSATYVVENLEGAGEHVKVAPGRLGAPVPFEFSRVLLPALGEPVEFKVFAPQHAYLDGESAAGSGELTVSPFALDPTSKYFLVLLALCEPRLRSPSAAVVPGATDVVDRLRALPSCRGLTRSAVNYHIDYLVATKLRLREAPEDAAAPGARSGGKREELVALALKFDLVREEHLTLLPPRHGR
ncbi:serine/threonine protein kinase [Kitasatospora sp. CM 4170]|uniref:Serine/threonine protein kinase n=1 Tax=Kitasatospora aburaviensis TaxID=67265 RepID=A0ABW1F487_9ACTN|nr:serine/threonine protein kinase [Kitasatospora sp. CM 4170]WNM49350.1 serine/threonine protein kinase [Kitasatospora sp. CM 4170]